VDCEGVLIIDFATFCYEKDAHRLYAPGHLKRMVESNDYPFNRIILVHQGFNFKDYEMPEIGYAIRRTSIYNIDDNLSEFGIDLNKPQYQSPTDKHHQWRVHVVNHLTAVWVSYSASHSDYIVFADSDCWIIKQPDSWVRRGIDILQQNPDVFIVSPNDGEPARKTQVMSQQMFMVRTEDFRQADFNQPGWDGNPHVPGGPLPEYFGMLEGRMELYCRHTNRYRYVMPSEYRYWHFNRTTQDGQLETDTSKY
jgi:hypothetical protein